LFDLDGFKLYNDDFGHPAGDALLARLGAKLSAALGHRGCCYRMGGDEFCTLTHLDDAEVGELIAAEVAALSEHGEGFSIACSHGSVSLPREASTPPEALRLADQRMYAQKRGGRISPGRQSTNVLLQALSETHPDLDDHLGSVAKLAQRTARRLGLHEGECEDVSLAAELHDIGKVALPRAILDKPGALTTEEWGFVKQHTLIGARIISAAPSLQRVAGIVRSTHESWDGSGYPDGLTGELIPLASRIILVCDAFDSMVSDRSYRRAMPEGEALEELRRCAGSQFDPAVVAALIAVLSESRVDRRDSLQPA